MSILSGLIKADSGEIRKRGELINIKSPNDATKHGIGMVYQEFMNFGDLTALDNIIMGNEPLNFGFIDRKYAREKISEICKKYNFTVKLDKFVNKMSVAMLQQLEIVRLLYRNADILILDEPTSVLTPQEIEGLFKALRNLRDKGKTVIIITHKLKEVMYISDDITVLKDGKVSGRLKADEADEKKLARLMVGREVLLNVDKHLCLKGEEILRIKNLCFKDENGIQKLKDVSLTVNAGEIVGICGIAGSGESELVSSIIGISDNVESGSIFLCNRDITRKKIADRRTMGMGYVPQDRNKTGVNRNGRIWESTFMGHHIVSKANRRFLIDRKKVSDYANRVIKEFAIKAQDIESRVSSLSGGNVQKLVVGREFLESYKLIVMEDPTRGVDVGSIEFIWGEILNYASQGMAILLVSHELNEIIQLSDRIFVMYQGELIEVESDKEITENDIGMYMLRGRGNGKQ